MLNKDLDRELAHQAFSLKLSVHHGLLGTAFQVTRAEDTGL